MMAKGCDVSLFGNKPGFTLPSNIGELGDDIVKLDLSQCSLQGITCRVAPTQRDGSESEISHTFPVPERFPGIRSTLAPSENFPLALLLRSPFPPTFLSSHTVTEEELRTLLPGCATIVV